MGSSKTYHEIYVVGGEIYYGPTWMIETRLGCDGLLFESDHRAICWLLQSASGAMDPNKAFVEDGKENIRIYYSELEALDKARSLNDDLGCLSWTIRPVDWYVFPRGITWELETKI